MALLPSPCCKLEPATEEEKEVHHSCFQLLDQSLAWAQGLWILETAHALAAEAAGKASFCHCQHLQWQVDTEDHEGS